MKEYATRVNLKTNCLDRKELIDFCLNGTKQYLAIGWSYVYSSEEDGNKICSYADYFEAVKNSEKRICNMDFCTSGFCILSFLGAGGTVRCLTG